uniref:Uncharacterized protein n=1 Tax=Anguilla anguilla TaxID=7936 RepID=A0A0E9SF17_ANGAN
MCFFPRLSFSVTLFRPTYIRLPF